MNAFSSPFYLVSPAIVSALYVGLVLVVWKWSKQKAGKRLFAFFLLSMAVTNGLVFGMRSSPNSHTALLWDRGALTSGLASFLFYYLFTVAYANIRGQKYIRYASYLLVLAIAALSPTSLLMSGMRIEDYGYAPDFGPVGYIAMLGVTIFIILGARNLLITYRATFTYEEKNRLLYLSFGTLLILVGGSLDVFTNLPPANIWANLMASMICSVAIIKYHLLDIRVVIRKGLTYVLVSSLVAVPYVGVIYIVQYVFAQSRDLWWISLPPLLLLAIALRPIYGVAQNFVDRAFYRDRYDYLQTLQKFATETKSVTDSRELSSSLVGLVSGAMKTSSACLLLKSSEHNGFIIASQFGLVDPPSDIILRNNSRLVRWLEQHGNILSYEKLESIPELQSRTVIETRNLDKIGFELLIPIRTRSQELSAILVLGKKLNNQAFSVEEERILTTLSAQTAVTLENSRLFNEVVLARRNLEKWLNSMSECVIIVDLENRVEFANDAAVKTFRVRRGEAIREFPGDANPSKCPIHLDVSNKAGKESFTDRIGDREFEITVSALASNVSGSSFIVVLRDITQRRQAEKKEDELQQQLYLSSRLAAVGELAAGVAHEINNPLTSVLGFSQRLLRTSTNESVRKDLQTIHNEALRAAKVVENLLTFARRRKTKKQPTNLKEILHRTLELRSYELRNNNIEVILDLAPDLPDLMVDFQQFQEVFLNILLNAEHAMYDSHSQGKITIRTETQETCVRVSFSDDGPGITNENLSKLFQPFFTTRTERGGTGLGLSICHGIVTRHGGKIYAKNNPKRGATFYIELPVVSDKHSELATEK